MVVNAGDGLHAGILGGGEVAADLCLVPVHNTADEGRDECDARLGAGDGLVEGKQQREVAVDAFLFQFLGGANAFLCGGDFDEDAFALDTILFVTRNQRPRLGEGGGGVEAQSRVHLGTHAARHDF